MRLVCFLIAVVLMGACAPMSAEQNFADSTIETYAERQEARIRSAPANTPSPTPTPVSTAEQVTPTPTPGLPGTNVPTTTSIPATAPDQEPEPAATETSTVVPEPGRVAPTPTHPVNATGAALGCDATPDNLRRLISDYSPEVREAAAGMVRELWICPITPEVHAQFVCYEEETMAVFDAVEQGLDEDDEQARSNLADVRALDLMFCASGDVFFFQDEFVEEYLADREARGE